VSTEHEYLAWVVDHGDLVVYGYGPTPTDAAAECLRVYRAGQSADERGTAVVLTCATYRVRGRRWTYCGGLRWEDGEPIPEHTKIAVFDGPEVRQ
jgi:hypothetical protein